MLRPDTFAGGLTLLQRGGSKETLSLRFRGADGRQYVFRSVDKEQGESLPEDLQGTLAESILQDMVTTKHPGAALVTAPLVRAAGVLNATPRLVVMADDPDLGKHREEFAGMLGTIEERPNEPEEPKDQLARDSSAQRAKVGNGADEPRPRNASPRQGQAGSGLPGATANGEAVHKRRPPYPLPNGDPAVGSPFDTFPRVIGEEALDERLEDSSEDRVDGRAYLTGRLIDMLVGDWDRHADQWRWAQDERRRTRYWLPIPRDRDNAFSHFGGLIGRIARAVRPVALAYEDRYSSPYKLIRNARPLDEPILATLPRAVWDSIARDLRARITDEVIDTAVARMPVEWATLNGQALARRLRARRDALPDVARDVYGVLAHEVHVRGTDDADTAAIEQRADGTVRVRLSATNRDDAVYFDRVLVPSETREVRVYLGGGADRAIVRGSGGEIGIRVIGGGGDDILEDAADADHGSWVAFYDDAGDNDFVVRPDTHVDRSAYEPPRSEQAIGEEHPPPPPDWGGKRTIFTPYADWRSIIGPVIGGGPSWTRYGFRRHPYASRFELTALYAPYHGRVGIEADARFVRANGGWTRLGARATGLSVTRFYGFGNETPGGIDSDLVRVWATEYTLTAEWIEEAARGLIIAAGPIVSHMDPTAREGSPADETDAFGTRSFSVGGLTARLTFDRRDSPSYPRQGAWLEAEAAGYPLVRGDVPDPFACAAARALAYIPLPGALEPTIALRTGIETGLGTSPLQYASFLGGSSTLRGYPSQRFAGETAVYGGSELRARLGRANLLIIKGDLGATLLADIGRVFVDGGHSRKWHAGYGGGLWFAGLDGLATAHLVYAYGEKGIVYAGLGLPF